MDNAGIITTIIIQSVLFIVGLFKIYTDMQMKLRELDVRMTAVEKQDDEMYTKLDRIMDAINEIRLELKDKQNR
jgi:hypothetical protein